MDTSAGAREIVCRKRPDNYTTPHIENTRLSTNILVPRTLSAAVRALPLHPQHAHKSQAPAPLRSFSPGEARSRNGVCGGGPVERVTMNDAIAQPSARRGSRVAKCVCAEKADTTDACTRERCCVRAGGRPPPRRERPFFLAARKRVEQSQAHARGYNSSFSSSDQLGTPNK